MFKKLILLVPVAALAFAAIPADAQVLPGAHPAYIHALGDLRNARWYLNRQPGDAKVYAGEDVAIQEIDKAIARIKKASIDDGKDINDHVKDSIPDRGSRLWKSIEFIDKAHADIIGEEDNPTVHALRSEAVGHVDAAKAAAVQAHSAWCAEVHCK